MKSASPISQATGGSFAGSLGAAAELGRQWRSGNAPALEDFLADWSSDELRPAVSARELAELVTLDQRQRWHRGQRPAAEAYLQRFPQLLSDDELALDVIYSEFLLREELGQEPKPEEYQLRFPNFAETLLDQIEFHQAMAANRSSGLSELDTRRSASATQSHPAGEGLPVHLTHSVPGYEILSELGRGGMGIVYRARQLSLNRPVALKMLRAGDCGSAALLARFQAEAEAVARLHHPNIVQIYDYGEHDGMPYLALELVDGSPLATAPGGNSRTARESAEIVATLARAVQFAHEQGIIHRDLKPANVLIAAPAKGSSGQTTVKITDFGLAKVFREGEESPTQTGTIIGTPSYMAPEQARGQPSLVGPATDVYALGAILYELVTGRPPFKAATAVEVLHQVLTTDAAPATRHVPRLARDLTTIIGKCLQKEPRQRYATAGELAEDLERFLADRPIRARRTSVADRGWRWCRRNPVLATLTCIVAGLLVAVAGVSILYSVHLREQLDLTSQAERREGDARKLAEVNLWDSYLGEIRAGNGSRQVGQRTRSLDLVDRANRLLDSIGRTPERVLKLRNATIASLAFADFLQERRLGGEPGQIVAFSVAADRFASLSPSGVAQVYRLSTGERLYAIPTQTGAGEGSVQLSADGRYLGIVNKGGAKVWRCQGETPPVAWDGPRTLYLTFSPDSRRAAASDFQGKIQLIDLGTGQTLPPLAGQHTARCACAFHPDSRRIAVCTMLGVVVFDVESGQVLSELPQSETLSGTGIVWHPGGQAVVVSGLEEGCALWDVAERRRLVSYPHRGPTGNLHFSCDGSLLVMRDSWSAELRIWSTGSGLEVLRSPRFAPLVADCSASEGDSFLLVEGDSLALWRLDAGLAPTPLLGAAYAELGEVHAISISPDNRLLAVGRQRGFEIWDLGTGRHSSQPSIPGCVPLFIASGDLLISSSWGLFRWPRSESPPASKSERGVCQFGPPERLSAMLADKPLGMTADGSAVAVRTLSDWRIVHPGGADKLVTIPASNQDDPRCLALSPDGRWLAMSNWHYPGTGIWDTASGRRVEKIPTGSTGMPLFSPDGRWLATTPDGGQLWSVGDWKPGASLHALGTTPSGLELAFSPDSSVLAVSQPQGTTRLVDPLSGADWAELLRSDPRRSSDLCFSPDQSLLIEMPFGDRSEPRVWRLTEIRRELASRGLDWPADVLPARPATDANPPAWTVVLNAGNLVNQQAAGDLVARAAGRKNLYAKQQLQQAIELDPENPQAHNELAWLLVAAPKELCDSQAAVRHARRALELNVDKATYWNTLGVALYRDAQYSEAVRKLEESLRRGGEPTAGFDLIFLALCHHALGNQELARQNLKEATAWFESHRMKLSSAWLEELTGFLNEANAKLTVADGRD